MPPTPETLGGPAPARAHLHAVDGEAELSDDSHTRGSLHAVATPAPQAPVPADSFETLRAGPEVSRMRGAWAAVWPKLAAVGMALAIWELVVLSGWRPDYVLPGPGAVFGRLAADLVSGDILVAAAITMKRAVIGYAIALAAGVAIGLMMARVKVLRTAAGSLLTGLQTMPSVAWFPLAILLFQLSENAMYFVVILGAAPSIANGVITGVDYVPPLLQRVGRNLGATGLQLYRYVIMPASLPSIVGGLKQGWAFAWRSLMAGELLVVIAATPSIGLRLDTARQLNQASSLIAWMIVILLIGILVDVIFGRANTSIRRRWGVLDA